MLFQSVLLLAAVGGVAFFLRFHVISSARQFESDFRSQSFFELANGEVHVLARKLSALSKKPDLICLTAERNGTVFFEEKKGSCRGGFFRAQSEVDQESFGIRVHFVHILPDELFNGFLILFAALASVGASLIWTQRRQFRQQHESELRLASLSRQIAHDLKSPLAAIRALSKGLGAAESKDLLRSTTERLDSLVANLGGEKNLSTILGFPPTVSKLLLSALAEKKLEFPGLNIQLEVKKEISHAQLAGDPFVWRRVISNLLNNAVESSPRTEVCISVTQEKDKIRIEVRDDGRGIPEPVIRRLGRDPYTAGKLGGKGIGVSSAATFLKELGGFIKIRSEEGKGTSVELHAPFSVETHAVLVEDDEILARLWAEAARARALHFQHFRSPAEFRKGPRPPKHAYIYLDNNFPDGSNGDDLGQELSLAGYQNLFLCSGAPGIQPQNHPWARGILGKEAPWLA